MTRKNGGLAGALCTKFPDPSYATFFEVHDKTGGHSRSADAMVMGLWKSRGLDLQGFEFKSDRGDWLRELKDPEKAERISQYCDYWWLCTTDEKVAKLEEIPKLWGLMTLKGKSLHIVKPAPALDAQPISRQFLAALLRRGHEDVMCDARVTTSIDKAREEGRERGERSLKGELESARRDRDYFKTAIEDFEKASGVKIRAYEGQYLGEAVKFLREMQTNDRHRDSLLNRVKIVRDLIEKQLHAITEGQESLEKAFTELEAPPK